MAQATNIALNSVGAGGVSQPLSSEFSSLSVPPDVFSGGWTRTFSSHSDISYEHSLRGSDKVVKIYIGDSNFGGRPTVTITAPTGSLEHYLDFPPYLAGSSVNTSNANDYLEDISGC